MPTYSRLPIALVRGSGAWVWDDQGQQYLDALSGIAVNTLGHAHPRLVEALQAQVATLIHVSNLYQAPLQEALAEALTARSGMTNAFFCNSGLEANEAAIKLARKHGHRRGFDRPEVMVFEKAFHGRSLATLSATANPKVQVGFEPLVEGFVRVPLNHLTAVREALDQHPQISAIFIETIQGEGGIQPAQIDFLQGLRSLCTERQILLMLDEVQCGIGRTGKWFAHQWAGVVPDVMPLAKGLGSGVPIGAVLAHGIASDLFQAGNHGTTFGGNPLAMRAALTTIEVVESEGLMDNAKRQGDRIMSEIRQAFAHCPEVVEVRGGGLMIGVELSFACAGLPAQGLSSGLLFNVTADRVIRLLPPLILNDSEVQTLLDRMIPLIQNAIEQHRSESMRAA
jgi:acetylornithine/N-succinyldiaminopimelate aminotransferase